MQILIVIYGEMIAIYQVINGVSSISDYQKIFLHPHY